MAIAISIIRQLIQAIVLEKTLEIACYTKALEIRNSKSFRRVNEQGYSEISKVIVNPLELS
jgi:hypothetical protein